MTRPSQGVRRPPPRAHPAPFHYAPRTLTGTPEMAVIARHFLGEASPSAGLTTLMPALGGRGPFVQTLWHMHDIGALHVTKPADGDYTRTKVVSGNRELLRQIANPALLSQVRLRRLPRHSTRIEVREYRNTRPHDLWWWTTVPKAHLSGVDIADIVWHHPALGVVTSQHATPSGDGRVMLSGTTRPPYTLHPRESLQPAHLQGLDWTLEVDVTQHDWRALRRAGRPLLLSSLTAHDYTHGHKKGRTETLLLPRAFQVLGTTLREGTPTHRVQFTGRL